MDPIEIFRKEREENISQQGDAKYKKAGLDFVHAISDSNYAYNFQWLGRPIIQLPQDMMAIQEIIWDIKPDLIIETGIAHGGSLIFSASILELIGHGEVLGVDIDIRAHNKRAIEKHPMFKRVTMFEGSSVEEGVIARVKKFSKDKKNVLVILDSNHTHDHVLSELLAYGSLVTKGSYCIVLDTLIEDIPDKFHIDREWGVGNNPKTAVWEFLESNDRFEIDKGIENKLLVTVAPDGYLKCVKD